MKLGHWVQFHNINEEIQMTIFPIPAILYNKEDKRRYNETLKFLLFNSWKKKSLWAFLSRWFCKCALETLHMHTKAKIEGPDNWPNASIDCFSRPRAHSARDLAEARHYICNKKADAIEKSKKRKKERSQATLAAENFAAV